MEFILGLTGFIIILVSIDTADRCQYKKAFVLFCLGIGLLELMPFVHNGG